ncbi:hypothetical protein RIR_jg9825.t1 [Rhizophagus irregularis DAOM 181602=DAOM 197198]|nr:hypothetical protein RIR_jg9825.t1 [Rhizophagus irregularis DAOM 181602=DAOM 197198]
MCIKILSKSSISGPLIQNFCAKLISKLCAFDSERYTGPNFTFPLCDFPSCLSLSLNTYSSYFHLPYFMFQREVKDVRNETGRFARYFPISLSKFF